jgi:hypothetical protein
MTDSRSSTLSRVVQSASATVGAVLGQFGDLAAAEGDVYTGTLTIDEDASRTIEVLSPGSSHQVLVQAGPDRPGLVGRRLCIKIPDAHGPGRDQDFLLASSGDGAPLHHAILPSEPVAALYSSLWLYLAGLNPILFGARPASTTGPNLRFGPGFELHFLISPPVGSFRRIGTLTLDDVHDGEVTFSGGNTGGGLRALPPVSFY